MSSLRTLVTSLLLAVLIIVSIVAYAAWDPRASQSPADRPTLETIDAFNLNLLLNELTIAEPVTTPAYQREHFGEGWADTDSNGCDTRNDVLARMSEGC